MDRPADLTDPLVRRRAELVKWARDPVDVLPAWVAEHDFRPPEAVFAAVHRVADEGAFGYTRRAAALGPAYASWARRRHAWEVDPELVTWHVDVLQGVVAAVTALSEPGEGLVITPPIYFPFLDIAPTTGRRQLEWRLRRDDTGWHLDPDDLDAVLRREPDARVLLLSHPHNPTGRVLDPAALARIVEICARHDVHIVSDEIHGDLVRPDVEFRPLLTVPGSAERTVVVTSAAKTFSLSGLRCAVSVFADPDLRSRVLHAHPPLLLGHPGRVGIEATIAAWEHGADWTDGLVELIGRRFDRLAERLAAEAPAVRWHRPEATFLAWLDVSACGLGPRPGATLLERARVAVSEGVDFGEGGEGHIRVNVGTAEAVFEEICDRLLPHLGVAAGGGA